MLLFFGQQNLHGWLQGKYKKSMLISLSWSLTFIFLFKTLSYWEADTLNQEGILAYWKKKALFVKLAGGCTLH